MGKTGTFRRSSVCKPLMEVSHLQLHLDSIDGQDFILEREGKYKSEETELFFKLCLRRLPVVQQLRPSLSVHQYCMSPPHSDPRLMNLLIFPPEDLPH